MITKSMATTIMVTLFLGSGVGPLSAGDARSEMETGAVGIGMYVTMKGVCKSFKLSAKMQADIDLVLPMVIKDRSLKPFYDEGVQVVITGYRVGGEDFCTETMRTMNAEIKRTINTENAMKERTSMQKAAWTAGVVITIQAVCPDVPMSGALLGYANAMLTETAASPALHSHYEEGVQHITDNFSFYGADEYCPMAAEATNNVEQTLKGSLKDKKTFKIKKP